MSEKRKLTPFLAHEMLFDYATNHLDGDRKQAIEEFIRDDKEGQSLLEAVRRGISYADSLKSIELSNETLQELDQSENFVSLSRRLARWSEWPDSLRWSIIALMVSFCTAGIVVMIPWKTIPLFQQGPSFDTGTVEIARVEPRTGGSEGPGVMVPNIDEKETAETGPLEGSGDEEFAEESSGATGTIAARPNVETPSTGTQTWQPAVPPPRPTVSVVVPIATPVAVAATAVRPLATPTVVAPVATPVSIAVAPTAAAKSSRSFVYRAFMTLSDLENITPKITQQIKELGAEKAGEVELGWRRGSGRYYHFSLPESNEQKLLESLRAYGPVRISKDPHPRVMPEGQVRFILWIESGI